MIIRNSPLNDPRKILVRATNWIGDAVLSLPALNALRSRFPAAEIVLVAKPWVSELYQNHPSLNRLIVYDPGGAHRGVRGFNTFIESLRREEFSAAVLLQNAFQAAWMAWRARIPVRVGYATDGRGAFLTRAVQPPPAFEWGHQSNYYLQMLFRAGLIEKPRPVSEVPLSLLPRERTWAAKQLRDLGLDGPRFLVGLSPGASFGPAKRWIPERFAGLADRLIGALDADVLIFGTESERPLAEDVARAMAHTPVIVAGKTTLRQWMALLGACRLVVTNDSGPMHVAAALGLPVLAIFGSTDERATGPLSPWARVVRRQVDCSPCGLRTCPIDFRCMKGVTVEDAQRAALALVKEWETKRARGAAGN